MTKKIIFKNAQKTFHAEIDYETKSNKNVKVTKSFHFRLNISYPDAKQKNIHDFLVLFI